MPIAPGWAIRSRSISATGTTSITITKPTGTVDGDIMFMCLSHKGTGYAVLPGGWTLVAQNISGAIRGEMYWRRASGEPANYTVTGLATAAQGHIFTLNGGLTAGNIIVSAVSQVNAAAATPVGPPVTTTQPHQMIVGMVAEGGSVNFGNIAQTYRVPTTQTFLDISINHLAQITPGSPTAASLTSGCVTKTVPGVTNPWTCTNTFENVCILAVIQQDTTTVTSGTRYYLATKSLPFFAYGPKHGEWDSEAFSPDGYSGSFFSWELSQIRAGAGMIQVDQISTNSFTSDILSARYFSPPLAAQTIAGTFNQCIAVYIDKGDGTVDNPVPTGYFKVHVYVTQGDSVNVRGVLLDRYTDPTPWNTTLTFRSLTADQTLTPVTCQAGDRICIEWGFHHTNATPFPPPVYPPNKWNLAKVHHGVSNYRGLAISGTVLAINAPAGVDAVPGTAEQNDTQPQCSHFDFSQTLVEQSVSIPPLANNSFATAATIPPALPFDTGFLDNRTTNEPVRSTWWKWTAPISARVIAHIIGSTQVAYPRVFTGDAIGGVTILTSTNHTIYTSIAGTVIDAVAGTTYYFFVESIGNGFAAPAAGGMIRLQVLYKQELADGDVITMCSGVIARYTANGILADISYDFAGDAGTGLAIDYTHRPMVTFNGGGMVTDLRLYAGLFGTGLDFVEILDLKTLNNGEAEIDFLSDPLWSNAAHSHAVHGLAAISIDRTTGNMIVSWFGDGFKFVADGLASYQIQVSENGTSRLNMLNCIQADDQPGAPFPSAVLGNAALEVGGTNYGELDQDGRTFYYASGGWYRPVGGVRVLAFDVVNNVQLPDFANVPAGPGPNPGLKGLFPLPSGGMLVTSGSAIYRLNAAGAIIQTYTPTVPGRSLSLADVELLDNSAHFWVLDQDSSSLFKFDLNSGAQLVDIWTQLGYGTSTSLVVYRANPFVLNPTLATLDIDCQTGIATIEGSNFADAAVITLIGPTGIVPFNLISHSDTEIVLQLPVPLASGTYCASVTNP
jgi:hypothetical protein